jgi:hypothetical protein
VRILDSLQLAGCDKILGIGLCYEQAVFDCSSKDRRLVVDLVAQWRRGIDQDVGFDSKFHHPNAVQSGLSN